MIYKVASLTDEELQHLYVKESTHLQKAIASNTTYNFVQSLKLTVSHLDTELKKRQENWFVRNAEFIRGMRA